MSESRPFLGALESLRGIAALLVVLSHMAVFGRGPLHDSHLVARGAMMVVFFFVLSGFVITYNYYEKLKNIRAFGEFVFLRFFRLYPIHLVFLLVWLGFECARYLALYYTGLHAPVSVPFHENNLAAFIENLFLVQALGFSGHAQTFNGPSWSISVEFYTYLVFAILTVLSSRKTFLSLAFLIATISFVALIAVPQLLGNSIFIVSCLAAFFLGTLACFAYERWRPANSWVASLCFIAFCGFLSSTAVSDNLLYPLSAMLVFTTAHPNNFVSRLLVRRPLQWLGRISYSLYMSHMAVLWLAGTAMATFSGASLSVPAPERFARLGDALLLTCYALVLGIVLAVADLFYRLVEAPMREWSRRQISALGHTRAVDGALQA